MRHLLRRRAIAALIAMLFGIGMIGHGVAVGGMSAQTVAAAAKITASMGDLSSGTFDGCDDDAMIAHAACVALCATSAAVLHSATEIVFAGAELGRTTVSILPLRGRARAPEPYPPRSV